MSGMLTNLRLLVLLAACAVLTLSMNLVQGAELEDPIAESITKSGPLVRLEPLAEGMTAPNWATSAPGDTRRLFVVDQVGLLWAVNRFTGDKVVFADLSALLVDLGAFGPGSFDERGFLGVAFHPDYQANGLLYTYTSEPASGAADFSVPLGDPENHHAVISEWQVPDPGDPASVVDPDSRRVVMSVAEPQFNHNAGAINFGSDGMLHIALGDGGGSDDQGPGHVAPGNGQDPSNILGNILRIDPLGTNSANEQYGVPDDNPFFPDGPGPFGGEVGCADGVCDEIFAWGFRNPFRFSFDSATGDMYAADVGQSDIEEINVVVAGGNYGWPIKEGSFCFDGNGAERSFVTDDQPCLNEPSMLIGPVAEYDHDEGIAIVGGFVYRGSMIPQLQGRYVFGDFLRSFGGNNGRLFFLNKKDLVRNNGTMTSKISEFRIKGQDNLGMTLLGLGQDAKGELYVLANMTAVPSGETGVVMKVAPLVGDVGTVVLTAALSGAEQPNPVDTPARGQAVFRFNHDRTALKFSVVVNRIENVIGAHLHLAPRGSNGGIVLSMIPDTEGFLAPDGGPFVAPPLNPNGFMVKGKVTAADLLGPLAGMPMAALIEEMRDGNIYINVHTVQNRGGEIRGQLK